MPLWAHQVTFLADSQLDLAKATGLSTELWSATRLRRFSMLVCILQVWRALIGVGCGKE